MESTDSQHSVRRLSKWKKAFASFRARSINRRYPTESLASSLKTIKTVDALSRSSDLTMSSETVFTVLSTMKRFKFNLEMQSVCCRAISNLAMNSRTAKRIVRRGGFRVIRDAMIRFEDDASLCRLGSGAIWNLSRPQSNRTMIGVDGVKLLMKTMVIHGSNEKVVNGTLGALSNLSVCDPLRDEIARSKHLDVILSTMDRYIESRSVSVSMTGAGLINNLAVNDSTAVLMIARNVIPMLLQLMEWTTDGDLDDLDDLDTIHRNTCSALRNLVDADNFNDRFLRHCGVERVFAFLAQSASDRVVQFLTICLRNVGVHGLIPTTSFHVCALNGNLPILKHLVAAHPHFDLDAVDSSGSTCLDYAVTVKCGAIVSFLSKCGAVKHHVDLEAETFDEEERKLIRTAVFNGKTVLDDVKRIHRIALRKGLPSFPTDVCRLMATFNGNVDMLKAVDQF